jgi:hypothetical protein
MRMIGVPLLLSLLLAADDKPTPKIPVGKETTVATGPLDKEGYIDYEAALNARLGKGITPQTNANVLLWRAFGPRPEGGKGMPAEFFKQLGIDEPPAKGDYFVGLDQYLKDTVKLAPDKFEAIREQQGWAVRRPWAAKDYPHIAGWLRVNDKPLAVVVEASKRPDYFNPLASHRPEKGPSLLLSALLPGVQKSRELVTALAARAMLRVQEGKFDEAWQDLLACHRLGRLVARGATLIEALVGYAVNQVASDAALAYLERVKLTAEQVRARLKDLQALPPLPPMADKIDLGERFMMLDSLQMACRLGPAALQGPGDGAAPPKPDPKVQQALQRMDWGPAFRNANRAYDRLVAILRVKDRVERGRQLGKFEEEIKALREEAVDAEILLKRFMAGEDVGNATTTAIGSVMLGLFMPAGGKVQDAADRAEQVQRNLHLAFALAAYRLENGRYPAKLEELAPRYLPSVPGDLFSRKALVYRPSEKGYLLYSVGVNGQDENGRWYDDDPRGDDLCVRMPLPEPKQKK